MCLKVIDKLYGTPRSGVKRAYKVVTVERGKVLSLHRRSLLSKKWRTNRRPRAMGYPFSYKSGFHVYAKLKDARRKRVLATLLAPSFRRVALVEIDDITACGTEGYRPVKVLVAQKIRLVKLLD